MTDKQNIEENNLDGLLNSLFLDQNSAEENENTARFVLQQEYDMTINSAKEKELLDKLQQKSGDGGNYWNFLMVLLIAAAGGIGILFYNKYVVSKSSSEKNRIQTTTADPLKTKPVLTEERSIITESAGISKTVEAVTQRTTVSVLKEKAASKNDHPLAAPDIAVYYPASGVGSKSKATFFKPTEQDFIFYGKVKDKMIERVLSSNKESYASVDAGELQYRNNRLTLYPFVLRTQPITNLEYKVFLADLIKNGLNEEFKIAV